MEHSIALVTGATSGLGYAAARMLASKGYRQVIVTGRSVARIQKTAAQLAAETKTQVFTLLVTNKLKRIKNGRKHLNNRSKYWAWERDRPTVRIEKRNKKGNSFLQKSSESRGSKKRP
jgi:NAD(P)-dependent dehydrogenase (short-subunit alcohol dehydrogenase family)